MTCRKADNSCSSRIKAHGLCVRHYRQSYYRKHRDVEIQRAIDQKRSFEGRILVAYQKLRQRCTGMSGTEGDRYYVGLPFLSQDEFISWAAGDEDFARLYENWHASGFRYHLTPTVDRKDPNKGYLADNIRWLSFSENASGRRDPGTAK